MSDDDHVLAFPGGAAEDAALAAYVAAEYAAFPARPAADAAACARAVVAAARDGSAAGRFAERGGGWRGLVPRQRWWWGAAAAAVLVAVTMRPWRPGASVSEADSAFSAAESVAASAGRAASPQGTVTPVDGGDAIRFDLRVPGATRDVALVGDFNGWDEHATPMLRQRDGGAWTAQVTLPPGRHVYAFVVDGQRWLVDPLAPQVPDAGFGPANALIIGGAR